MPDFTPFIKEFFPSLTVGRFFNGGRVRLCLDVLAGHSGLPRTIQEAFFHRPGLAMAKFTQHFPAGRIQVVGTTETAYLDSCTHEERVESWRRLFDAGVVCVIVTQPLALPPEVLLMAEKAKVVVMRSTLPVPELITRGLLVLHDQTAPYASLGGTMVSVAGVGVLLTGEPGVGKSETALGIIRRGGSLISDDRTRVDLNPYGVLMARSILQTASFMEIRGLGLLHIPSLFGMVAVRTEATLNLIVTLVKTDPEGICDRTGELRTRTVLGKEVTHLVVPVAPGRDLVNIIETAALAHRMRDAGFDAAASLDERLKAHHQALE